MYLPQDVLAAAGSSSNGKSIQKTKIRVELHTLEGQSASSYRGAPLECEVRLEYAKQARPNKLAVVVASYPDTNSPTSYALQLASGTPACNFDVPGPWPGPLSRNELRVRVKLQEQAKGAGKGAARAKLLGELSSIIPLGPNASLMLSGGSSQLTLRMDVHWEGLDKPSLSTLAEHVGKRMLEVSTQQKWQELSNLSKAAPKGWGQISPDTVAAVTTGQVNKDGCTALRFCIEHRAPIETLKSILDARSNPHAVATDGTSPFTAALKAGTPYDRFLVEWVANVSPKVSRAIGIRLTQPWIFGPVDWESLRKIRCFDLVLVIASEFPSLPVVTDRPDMWKTGVEDMGRSSALADALCYAVHRRFCSMSSRVLSAMAPLHGQASAAEALLLEQMLRLAKTDNRWFGVAQAQLARGAAVGTKAWRGGHRVLVQLVELAAKGQPRAQEVLLDAALGKEWEHTCYEPRLLFPERAAECAVCFETLYQHDPCYFMKDGKRACLHYVCGDCAPTLVPSKECPLCMKEIDSAIQFPSLEFDPGGWFRAAAGGDGFLEPGQLCHAVAASLPVSEENLMRAIESESGPFKRYWDKDFDGRITEEEFFHPENGLFAWMLAHLQELHRAAKKESGEGKSSVPDLRTDPAVWFDFWDDRRSGSLSFGQVSRGMFASLQISALEDTRHTARINIGNCWHAARGQTTSVTKNEFLQPGGLASMLRELSERAAVKPGEVSIAAMPLSPQRKLALSPPEVPKASPQQNTTPNTPLAAQQDSGDAEDEADGKITTLVAMGFPIEECKKALKRAGGNVEHAIAHLLDPSAMLPSGTSTRGRHNRM